MARTEIRKAPPAPQPGSRPATVDPEGDPFATLYNLISAHKIVDEANMMIVPDGRYPYDGDSSSDAMWRAQEDGAPEAAWHAAEVWEHLRRAAEDVPPVIVRYERRDEATGLPIVEAFTDGISLSRYLLQDADSIYAGPGGSLDIQFIRLFRSWALNALEALEFLHTHGVLCLNTADTDSFWIRSDRSLALVGLMGAAYFTSVRAAGKTWSPQSLLSHEGRQQRSIKTDLFDWATLVYELMSHQALDVETVLRGTLPPLEDEMLGSFVHKCWRRGYESTREALIDVRSYIDSRNGE